MPLTIINAAGVRRLLPMNECIDVMESAMIAAMCAVCTVDAIVVWGRNPGNWVSCRKVKFPADKTTGRLRSTSPTASTPRTCSQQRTSMEKH